MTFKFNLHVLALNLAVSIFFLIIRQKKKLFLHIFLIFFLTPEGVVCNNTLL